MTDSNNDEYNLPYVCFFLLLHFFHFFPKYFYQYKTPFGLYICYNRFSFSLSFLSFCKSWPKPQKKFSPKMSLWGLLLCYITVKPVYTGIVYNGHLVIADTFLRNRPNHAQTLIEKSLYSGHLL